MRRRFLGGDRLSKKERRSPFERAAFAGGALRLPSSSPASFLAPVSLCERLGDVGGVVWRGLERRTGLEDGSDKVAGRGDEEEEEESVEAASLLRARLPYVRLTRGVVVFSSVVCAALQTEAVIASAHHAWKSRQGWSQTPRD